MALTLMERQIIPSLVKPGMLLRMMYTTGEYMVFVVNPNRMNTVTRTPQLHAYKLNGILNESGFINILVELNAALVIDSVNKEITLEAMSDTAAYEARYVLRDTEDRPYRKFTITNITSIRQLFIELPTAVDSILDGTVTIMDKGAKRKLLTCAQSNDIECIKSIPEVKSRLRKTTPSEREEVAEREKMQQVRERPIEQVLKVE